MSRPQRTDFDIAIVGGGMVGAGLAAMAASDRELGQLRIALIDVDPPAAPPAEDVDIRVSAISRSTEHMLSAIGVWSQIPINRRSPYTDMIVWDESSKPLGPGSIQFSASETSEPNLGHIVENRQLQWAIYGAPRFRDRVTLLRSSLSGLELGVECATATLLDGRSITASLVIGADGASSLTRKLAGIDTLGWNYDQRAFVTHVRTEHSHRQAAWQRFRADGPIAFLPLADGRSSIVWTTRPEHAEHLVNAPLESVNAEIARAVDDVFGAVHVDAARASFPLRLTHARQYCRSRFALVGDAAHAVHPLAGQGVNLGFLDAAALVQTLSDAIKDGATIDAAAELRVLRRYERWRKSENALALGLIDGLNRLFSNSSDTLRWFRRTGLSLVNGHRLAKRALMGRAMGIAGDVPRLATGLIEQR